ncbi:anthranilate phosphoribosyltransferase [Haladaptatus pallidirubidus]|uniref:Anthranilate phosphoribosyltransferase n=1 Tax=Haladaptatus pallidirubidus TaxID=1008152 RepID=A0AAV3UBP8_9EURY|nr:anthranilate phosphoribosyltransferase [Haladaptatus pallidirubidus]
MAQKELRDLMSQVGSGPKSAEDMSYEQAYSAFERILSGDADPTALGGFWLANRWKRNTPEELAGFLDAMRENSVEVASSEAVASPDATPVDCGANYDGKRETALLGVAAGLVSAASGIPVVVHSGDRVPMSEGCAYRHVLSELGVETDLEPEESAKMVDSVGFGFYDQSRFNPDVYALLDRRSAVGVRTFINTVETLANPADARVHLGSFYHLSFAKRIIDTLRESRTSTVERAILFQGLEGYDDVRPGYTKVAEWNEATGEEGELTDYEIETANYGMSFERDDLEVESVAEDSARITESVLSGERDDRFADAVALNAAFRIYAGGGAESLDDGLETARRTIADGEALESLSELRRVS